MRKTITSAAALLSLALVAPVVAQVQSADSLATDSLVVDAEVPPIVTGPDYYAITTPQGRVVVELSRKTPYHRAAFQQSVAEGTYDSTLFHRVIQGFMIQGGDPLSKNENPGDDGRGEAWPELVPAEFDTDSVRTLFHRRGALAAARQGDFVNPERKSGGQFYIVQGRVFFDAELDAYERVVQERTAQPGFRYSPEEREAYTTLGGAPQLDQQYTVFGYVVEGMDVVDRVAAVPVRPGPNRPLEPVRMTITPLQDYAPPAPQPAPADTLGAGQ